MATLARARRAQSRQLALRGVIAVLAVVASYHLSWHGLKFLTSELNLRLDNLAGLGLRRLSFDSVTWHGVTYRYEIACIFADVWCGAIPLLWDLRQSVARNLRTVAYFSIGLLAFNVLRLSVSDILFSWGVPWVWGHEALGGAAWFGVWAYLWTRGAWRDAGEAICRSGDRGHMSFGREPKTNPAAVANKPATTSPR
jgi:hypothetical protein